MKNWIRDLLRGYSDKNLEFAKDVLENREKYGTKVEMTGRQFKALITLPVKTG
jgi:hypothetical protein